MMEEILDYLMGNAPPGWLYEAREKWPDIDDQIEKTRKSIANGLSRFNLKAILMELGNQLVTRHGFDPGRFDDGKNPSTLPICSFTEWLNDCKEAREILYNLGIDWPVTEK